MSKKVCSFNIDDDVVDLFGDRVGDTRNKSVTVMAMMRMYCDVDTFTKRIDKMVVDYRMGTNER